MMSIARRGTGGESGGREGEDEGKGKGKGKGEDRGRGNRVGTRDGEMDGQGSRGRMEAGMRTGTGMGMGCEGRWPRARSRPSFHGHAVDAGEEWSHCGRAISVQPRIMSLQNSADSRKTNIFKIVLAIWLVIERVLPLGSSAGKEPRIAFREMSFRERTTSTLAQECPRSTIRGRCD
jgi:hypothetical protein